MDTVYHVYTIDVAATRKPSAGWNSRDSTDATATISTHVGRKRKTIARHIAVTLLVPASPHHPQARSMGFQMCGAAEYKHANVESGTKGHTCSDSRNPVAIHTKT